ncbi:MAG: alpha-galactosidase [Clostridia bacterium]|nr:alpha-galactosidase [Clostridia bacterium]
MIKVKDGVFFLETEKTSYIFSPTAMGHPEHIFYGPRVEECDIEALRMKNTVMLGSSVDYLPTTPSYSLDNVLLEYSGIGKGDFRHSPIEIIMPDGSFVTDFVYSGYALSDGAYECDALPTAYGPSQTLTVEYKDKKYGDIVLKSIYTVFEECNVICRATELVNGSHGEVIIRKLMSFMLDIPAAPYDMITFDGTWAREAHLHRRRVEEGILVNDSTTGSSSNRHNPGFLLAASDADEERGRVYGFNLVYSGNHYSAVEKGPFGTVRVMSGINPHCFLWKLKSGESFSTPEAVMTLGESGYNSVMENMHAFVNEHIVRGEHKGADRPVVLNNWEAHFFNFNCRKLHSLAGKAKKLGVEMFVLDDGWFGARNNDRAGLGDWCVNTKKLPGGIRALAKKINKMGMKFGLWFEPECVNEDSDLFRAHPDWIIKVPDREGSVGRNQYVLDLTRTEVQDYIVDAVDRVLSSANIEYVKWDYNRHISDAYSPTLKNQGEFYHRYILGLYSVLQRIFHEKHPNILFESCSSGGNRFDLGMLCYSPQIWTSDNTDPIERLDIQGGIYCLYPQSTVSAHVSMAPHQQTLRSTPLSTRFNVAAFGVLGYELDFGELTPHERREIAEEIAFYKKHRKAFQYGRLYFVKTPKPNQISWQIKGEGEIFAGLFQKHSSSCPERDTLRVPLCESDREYSVQTVKQYLRIGRFGSLIKHITPIELRADGFIVRTVDRHFAMTDGKEFYKSSGRALSSGISLAMQYEGTGYNDKLRILGDYGSNIYHIRELEGEQNGQTNKAK